MTSRTRRRTSERTATANYLMRPLQSLYKSQDVVQVNLPAESGEMGVLANHVPSIEQLKPGLVEIVEESGSSKQFFRMWCPERRARNSPGVIHGEHGEAYSVASSQCPADSPSSSPTRP